jgi:hypothetical protein
MSAGPTPTSEAYVTESLPHSKIDTTVPQTARVWNYWLGGNDNYQVDRALGDEIEAAFPIIVEIARGDRAVLNRAVRYLAGEAGVRQFLDIGTGLPTANNTHEVAQAVAPESRIVYVDYDPLVLVHARALLTSGPDGATDYIDADIRDTERIMEEARRTRHHQAGRRDPVRDPGTPSHRRGGPGGGGTDHGRSAIGQLSRGGRRHHDEPGARRRHEDLEPVG